ncbi:MAG: uracil phosphoribosyltransferase [Bacteroidales bacterium]|nr:uracil phosphoribosyltransferase [Bacteroidales bacterium]
MKLVNIGEQSSILNSYMAEMRDARIQKDSLRFRTNLERVGAIFAYEISKTLPASPEDVHTPLGVATVVTPDEEPVVASILRAGLPLGEGMLRVFDHAQSAFLTTFRKYGKGDYSEIRADYCNCPPVDGKVVIVADAMAATGESFCVAMEKLCREAGKPSHIHLVCPIASRYAVDQLSQKLDDDYTLWVAAIDEELTGHNYIIPGLGDAGDLAFGEKA